MDKHARACIVIGLCSLLFFAGLDMGTIKARLKTQNELLTQIAINQRAGEDLLLSAVRSIRLITAPAADPYPSIDATVQKTLPGQGYSNTCILITSEKEEHRAGIVISNNTIISWGSAEIIEHDLWTNQGWSPKVPSVRVHPREQQL